MIERIVTDALRARTTELSTVHPGAARDDLAAFGAALSGVTVVGLGEATHGSRELFTLKHRLMEYLVIDRGFTVFALEATSEGCQALDTYITTGRGQPARALQDLGYWTWNTEEMLSLLHWLRAHNTRAPLGLEVRLVGVDPPKSARQTTAQRDLAMAEAVLRLDGRKVMFWAHNGHISARYITGWVKAAGGHLRDQLGRAYYALALTFHHGSFQALRLTLRGIRGPEEFAIGSPRRRSIEHTLAAITPGDHLVNIRDAATEMDLANWAGQRQRMRSFGSIMPPLASDQLAAVVPAVDFDGIGLVRSTTRAQSLPIFRDS